MRKILIFLFSLFTFIETEEKLDGNYLNEVSEKYITPHIKLAKPYSKGKIKVLFIVPQSGARETVELAQRISLEYKVFITGEPSLFAKTDKWSASVKGTSPFEKKTELLNKLSQNYDAIILGNVNFSILPFECQKNIFEKVEKGTGLLICYYFPFPDFTEGKIWERQKEQDIDFILNGVPIDFLPFFKINLQKKFIKTYDCGKGRICVLDYGFISSTVLSKYSLTPESFYNLETPFYYNLYLSLVAKSLLWVVPEKIPNISIGKFVEEKFDAPYSSLNIKIPLKNICQQPILLKIEANLSQPLNEPISLPIQEVFLNPGEEKFVIYKISQFLPEISFFNLYLRSKEGIENWASFGFQKENKVKIKEISLNKELVSIGEEIKCEVIISNFSENLKLKIELFDIDNRVIERSIFPVKEEKTKISFIVPSIETTILNVIVSLFSEKEEISHQYKTIFVKKENKGKFNFIIWGGTTKGILAHFAYQQIRKQRFDAVLSSGDGREILLNGLQFIPYCIHIGGIEDYGSKEKEDSLLSQLSETVKKAKSLSIFSYSLGDETFLGDMDSGRSQPWLTKFRDYLKEKYGDITELNKRWKTSFSSWEEVKPDTFKESSLKNNWISWIEHRFFYEDSYTKLYERCKKVVCEIDPGIPVGFEGSGGLNPIDGTNFEKMSKVVDFWAPYPDPITNSLLCSFAPSSLIRGNWFGGYTDSHGGRTISGLKNVLWDSIFKGSNSIWYYCLEGTEGILGVDLDYTYYFKYIENDLKLLKNGLGKYLMESEKITSPVAILYSPSSILVSQFSSKLSSAIGGYWPDSHKSILAVLEDIGYQPIWVSSSQIENGNLSQREYKVLILPYSQAISDKEAEQIKKFVFSGGVLIGDINTGVFDELGEIREKGILDEVFGIKRNASPLAPGIKKEIKVSGNFANKNFFFYFPSVNIGEGIEQTTSSSLVSDIPILFVNEYGKGKTLFLNFSLDNYLNMRGKGEDIGFRDFIKLVLENFGVLPIAEVFGQEEKFLSCQKVLFQKENVFILGLLPPEYLKETQVSIKLKKPYYVYDILNKKFIGNVSCFQTFLSSEKIGIFSLLQEEPKNLKLEVGKQVEQGKFFDFNIISEDNLPHLVSIELFNPEGEKCLWFNEQVYINKNYKGRIKIAYNEKLGFYTLKIFDVITGREIEKNFQIKKRENG
ncbi:MAG: beta-galactosidase [Candidatus Omnitrophica bacterium]|nr:beta-galactosidase [Candidatus Omnitrophota bacterium]